MKVIGPAAACVLFIGGMASAPLRAADPPINLERCRAIADPAARLDCFDRGAAASSAVAPAAPVAPLTPAPPVSPAARPAPAAPSPPVLDAQQQFGLPEKKVAAQEVAAGTRAADASKIAATITQVTQSPDQRVLFTLDNRQVWRQLLLEADLLAKPGDSVTISRGLLGSFWLQLPSGRGCKVTRLR